jgi:hypothetical protein
MVRYILPGSHSLDKEDENSFAWLSLEIGLQVELAVNFMWHFYADEIASRFGPDHPCSDSVHALHHLLQLRSDLDDMACGFFIGKTRTIQSEHLWSGKLVSLNTVFYSLGRQTKTQTRPLYTSRHGLPHSRALLPNTLTPSGRRRLVHLLVRYRRIASLVYSYIHLFWHLRPCGAAHARVVRMATRSTNQLERWTYELELCLAADQRRISANILNNWAREWLYAPGKAIPLRLELAWHSRLCPQGPMHVVSL